MTYVEALLTLAQRVNYQSEAEEVAVLAAIRTEFAGHDEDAPAPEED